VARSAPKLSWWARTISSPSLSRSLSATQAGPSRDPELLPPAQQCAAKAISLSDETAIPAHRSGGSMVGALSW
jgi:hypothetical protein